MRHIHLHPLGGAAGDMFVACLLDAYPELRQQAIAAAQAMARVPCRTVPHTDGTLTGFRFEVEPPHTSRHGHGGGHGDGHGHAHHAAWRDIRARLEASALAEPVCAHAVGIFAVLAEAEGRVHGMPADEVTFHEIGAADSIADIVAAAAVIAALGPTRWTVASLPLGGGTVHTAHGPMPVPAPATALLLEGFTLHDDGIMGERVTPTGAAILRYLGGGGGGSATPAGGTLRRTGYGFGSRRLPGISNCLRALVFDADGPAAAAGHRQLAVVSFEVDDQSGEDLATGLERLRSLGGVHDVLQMPAFGKKSRLAVHVQVLAAPEMLEDVVKACFSETTTIGLRTHLVEGRALPRRLAEVEVEGHALTVKLVQRPGTGDGAVVTGKAEADHLRPVASHAARVQIRQEAERLAQSRDRPAGAGQITETSSRTSGQ